MKLMAIDPGNTRTAWIILLANGRPESHGISENAELLNAFRFAFEEVTDIAIEYFAPRGMPTSKEEMATIFYSGRLIQAAERTWHPITRLEEKIKVCGSAKAKDSNIRQALIDLYGGETAIGKKKTPGPLYGVSQDIWQALAVGVAHFRKTKGDTWAPILEQP